MGGCEHSLGGGWGSFLLRCRAGLVVCLLFVCLPMLLGDLRWDRRPALALGCEFSQGLIFVGGSPFGLGARLGFLALLACAALLWQRAWVCRSGRQTWWLFVVCVNVT